MDTEIEKTKGWDPAPDPPAHLSCTFQRFEFWYLGTFVFGSFGILGSLGAGTYTLGSRGLGWFSDSYTLGLTL